MRPDADLEFQNGMLAAMAGDYPAAIAAYQRALTIDPWFADARLNLLTSYMMSGRIADADAMVEHALRHHGQDQAFLVAIATLRESQGRYEDALALIHDRYVDLGPESSAYPSYLRILVGAQRWDEAVLAARGALTASTFWTPYARLARILALLHFNEDTLARTELALFDAVEFADLIDDWVAQFERSGAIGAIRALLAGSALANEPALVALRGRFGA